MTKYDRLVNFCQHNMISYNSIYDSYADVLEHLFFVLGNGYKYVDGDIVYNNKKPKTIFKEPSLTPKKIQKLLEKLEIKNEEYAKNHRNPTWIRKYNQENMAKLKAKIDSGFFARKDNLFSKAAFHLDFIHSKQKPYELYPICDLTLVSKFDINTDKFLVNVVINFLTAYFDYIDQYMQQFPETKLNYKLDDYREFYNRLLTLTEQ